MSHRLRIALYYNVGWGGGRRWLYECASRLRRCHDVDLFCIERRREVPNFPDANDLKGHAWAMPLREFAGRTGWLKPLNAALEWVDLIRFDCASKKMAAHIDAAGYDLLFASVGRYAEAPLVLRYAATPSAYYCHEPMRNLYEPAVPRAYERTSFYPLFRKLWGSLFYGVVVRNWDREATRKAGTVLMNSRYCRDYAFRAYGVRGHVNYPGVDPDAFEPGPEPRQRFVLTVGELLPTKGIDWSIRAVGSIAEGLRPTLVVVCNRSYSHERRYLEEVARERGVTLDIRERAPDVELKRLYREAACVIYTPHREPFGLVAIEAMASGTPVVAVREAGPAETIVNDVTGFLCDRDEKKLGEAVLRLLDDAELRQRLGRAGREHVIQNWTWDRSVEDLQQILANAVHPIRSTDGSRASDVLRTADVAVARRRT